MTRWAAFVGLTFVVLATLLVLARLSQTMVSDRDATAAGTGPRATGGASRDDNATHERDAATDPVIPQFESPSSPAHDSGAGVAEMSTAALLANVALTQGVFGVILIAGALYFGVPLADLGLGDSPLATGTLGLAVGVVFGVGLWVANETASLLAEITSGGYDETLRAMLAPDSLGGWILLLGAILPTIAFVEELIFRAAAIGALSAGLGISPWLLAVVSSLAFGLAHGAQGKTGILITGGLGFALAAGFILTESLLVVVVAHYLVNVLEMVIHEGFGYGRISEHV